MIGLIFEALAGAAIGALEASAISNAVPLAVEIATHQGWVSPNRLATQSGLSRRDSLYVLMRAANQGLLYRAANGRWYLERSSVAAPRLAEVFAPIPDPDDLAPLPAPRLSERPIIDVTPPRTEAKILADLIKPPALAAPEINEPPVALNWGAGKKAAALGVTIALVGACIALRHIQPDRSAKAAKPVSAASTPVPFATPPQVIEVLQHPAATPLPPPLQHEASKKPGAHKTALHRQPVGHAHSRTPQNGRPADISAQVSP